MPEKKYPPRFDFKAMQPGVPVEFTLLKKPFSGQAAGEDYEWHNYPCSCAGNEVTVFTPHERVHAALQYLKVLPGTKFTITKGSDINTDTGKSFVFYTIKHGDQTVDTKNELTNGAEEVEPEAEDSLADTPIIKEPGAGLLDLPVAPDYVGIFEMYYGPIMTAKLKYFETRINMQKLTDGQFAELLIALDKSTSANVSTILIQSGK